jgi:uncharacterized membrane protein
MSKTRLEAFSDGVLAVAITLLVLDIKVPNPATTEHLGRALAHQWPVYLAYVTSFVTIGIIWINHHAMLSRLRQVDHTTLMLNLLLLMSIAVLPFATRLMSAYLKEARGQHLAAAIYSGSFLAMSILFVSLNWHILFAKSQLLQPELSEERRRRIIRRGATGVAPYVVATALAAVSSFVTIAICAAVAVFYALPLASGTERGALD